MKTSKETYEELIANIFGLFEVKDYNSALRMTLEEYNLRMKGYLLKVAENEYNAHMIAFANLRAKGTKKNGAPLYDSFNDFYDKKARLAEITGIKNKIASSKLVKIARRIQARKEDNTNGISDI
ncbi:hypothetical protein HZY83_07360 [Gemella sp. GH3]|uniref:hypothetical protein n=1 Tax=unclassified Gemella TaxID=2624949 RepID=UPI0015CF943B|nr:MULTISPECIES: hypothetical protein [unclassified Gemella]MBF0714491.1 hypothetical protein [Gemella sp. GH3.1]NYS51443.1 hypothetical protein [Gemella sp. GH3]